MQRNLIQIQREFIDTVNSGFARWSKFGHFPRIYRGAWRRASGHLSKLGYTDSQIKVALRDALDIAELERIAE